MAELQTRPYAVQCCVWMTLYLRVLVCGLRGTIALARNGMIVKDI